MIDQSTAVFAAILSDVIAGSYLNKTVAKQLGWVNDSHLFCGGFYADQAIENDLPLTSKEDIEITSDDFVYAKKSTSTLTGHVQLNKRNQQLNAKQAYLYRDPKTYELRAIDLFGPIQWKEPNSLVLADHGYYDLKAHTKRLIKIIYKTVLRNKRLLGPKEKQEMSDGVHQTTDVTAWGCAEEFFERQPLIYELSEASFSTCAPDAVIWQLQARHLVLNKKTGRGDATHAWLLMNHTPILYLPYINFPIDKRRKTGFLSPTLGHSSQWGMYLQVPFYWNVAPATDMIITPRFLNKRRNIQWIDTWRYLMNTGAGEMGLALLAHDQSFSQFQDKMLSQYKTNPDPIVQAQLQRLLHASATRYALSWRHASQFNEHWSANVDYHHVSDDYYLQDFGNLNEVSENQLLQEANIAYRSKHWILNGRVQAYQTLHPLDQPVLLNQYRRFPQLLINGDYPDQFFGSEWVLNGEFTRFDIVPNPGMLMKQPIGERFHLQPGISWPVSSSYFDFNPRIQLAMTRYHLSHTDASHVLQRVLPIVDLKAGAFFSADLQLFHHAFRQTLEPQLYYTYIPYRRQSNIPLFDTSVNTLTYDQLFVNNRFSSIDRIGDANQVSVGVASAFIDSASGLQKARLSVGQIIYFSKRRVTLCNDATCTDNPANPENHRRFSSLTSTFSYNINPLWSAMANMIWNPVSKRTENALISLHYQPDRQHIINFSTSYVRDRAILMPMSDNASDHLYLTDFSFAWPVSPHVNVVGDFSRDWRLNHFQRLLYGIEYNTCCFAVRFVAGRTFTNATTTGKYQYNAQAYIQVMLKGLGSVGTGNPTSLLSNVAGYRSTLFE